MGFAEENSDEAISGINITPLVDVVLVLLIIFLITAPVIYQSAIKVTLPKAVSSEQAGKTPLSFSINQQGELSWNSQVITWADLEKRLKALTTEQRAETVMLSADQATPHGTVVRLMDTLRQAGILKFALNVDSVGKKIPDPASQ